MPEMTPPPQFSRRRSLLYAAILVAAFFAVVEGALRLVGVSRPVRPRILLRGVDADIDFPFMRPDREVFWSPKPGWRGQFLGHTVTINSLGLRGPEPVRPKPPGWQRVVMFGDSITFGYGVSDDQTYAAEAARALAADRIDVVNAGVTGFTSHQVLHLLRRVGPALQPDLATICIGWNDSNRRPVDDRAFARHLRAAQRVEFLADRLYLYRAMKTLHMRLARRPPSDEVTRRVSLEHYADNLRQIVGECRARGVRPVFLALPRRHFRGQPAAHSAYADVLAAVAAELSVDLVPLGPLGLGADHNADYFIDALHLNPEGHALMARTIVAYLRESGLAAAARGAN
jgi:lysophospholipase L1-like esterase